MPTVLARRPNAAPAAAAAVIGLLLGSGATYVATRGDSGSGTPSDQVMTAALKPLDVPAASGTATLTQAAPERRTLSVTTAGLPPQAGSFYEVWLLDPATNGMVAVGVLGNNGQGSYVVPAGLDMTAYNSVDVSVQPMNGSTDHSSTSAVGICVLMTRYLSFNSNSAAGTML